jgi:hypothetical protein
VVVVPGKLPPSYCSTMRYESLRATTRAADIPVKGDYS